MKKNLPITNSSIELEEGVELISTTNAKGIITSVNGEFEKICGFTEKELLGENHNIVRHPDMPPAAFADLWSHLKRGEHWMGLVKNRCKNGDHYWADAYISPIQNNGKIVSCESVRVKPSEELVDRAEYLYEKINAGKPAKLPGLSLSFKQKIFYGASTLSILTLLLPVIFGANSPLFIAAMLFFIILLSWSLASTVAKPLTDAANSTKDLVNNPLMQLIYTGRSDEIGQLQLSNKILKAQLRTVLGRVRQSTGIISDSTAKAVGSLDSACTSMKEQCHITESVNTAVEQASSSIQRMKEHSDQAAQIAKNSYQESRKGATSASKNIQDINMFSETIEVVGSLKQDANSIEEILDIIRGISSMTNLLALNASIEAARAGEHGRGFAVVANEVRGLAKRTQASTSEIEDVVTHLHKGVDNAIKIISHSSERAEKSRKQVQATVRTFEKITENLSEISTMNDNIASSVNEQSSAIDNISESVMSIRKNAKNTANEAHDASESTRSLAGLVNNLDSLTQRFST